MADKALPAGRIYNDVTTFDPQEDLEEAEAIVGGFPCQAWGVSVGEEAISI